MSMWDNITIETEGDVHHYINNALGVIIIDVENIRRHGQGNLTIHKALDRILKATDNLTLLRDEIVKQLIK